MKNDVVRLPTEDEINIFHSLDERVAVKHFLGKDLRSPQGITSSHRTLPHGMTLTER